MKVTPPNTLDELMIRAHALAGIALGDLADALSIPVPANLTREKGWVGQLLEQALGATAGSRAEPDFIALGVELKTLPVCPEGVPKESTFVSTIPLTKVGGMTWETSIVKKKLNQVLWIPVVIAPGWALAERRLGRPLLWQATAEQEMRLRQDWEELTEMIALGQIAQISARMGTYLQVRPKGANNKALCPAFGEHGEPIMTLPRGFYLRARFTRELLSNAVNLA